MHTQILWLFSFSEECLDDRAVCEGNCPTACGESVLRQTNLQYHDYHFGVILKYWVNLKEKIKLKENKYVQ